MSNDKKPIIDGVKKSFADKLGNYLATILVIIIFLLLGSLFLSR